MNVLSLFDGISCGKVALERAGIKVDKYYASEIDKYAIQISKKNHPDIVHLGDVTNWKNWNLPEIDLIIGGSPCQGFSRAGAGLNFEDPRSKLFFTFVEILNHYKPQYFLLENVVMKKESKDIITEYLGVEPVMINSSLVSAQNRKRLYWANFPISQPEDKGILIKDILEPDVEPTILHNLYGGFKETKPRVFTEKSPTIRTSAGGGHIPSAIKVGNLYEKGGQNGFIYSDEGKSPSLVAGTGKKGRKISSGNSPKILVVENIYPSGGQNGNIYDVDGKSPSIMAGIGVVGRGIGSSNAPKIAVSENKKWRRLTPLECERLQTLPEGYTEGVSDTQRYKGIGNGWTVDVIAHIFKQMFLYKE